MSKLAKRIRDVAPSATLALTSLAKKMKGEGKDVVSFCAGEPDFDTPTPIKEAAKRAIDQGVTKYTPAGGTPELKKAICDKFLKDNGLRYSPEQIVVSCGAKHSIYNLLQVLCNKGDEVIIISPYWLSYPEMVKLAEGKPITIFADERKGFKPDIKKLKSKINKNTKALIVNSPSNPAGIVYNKKELEEIADIAVSKKIYCISDEIYEKLIYDDEVHVSIGSLGSDIYKHTITVNGVSKSYSMTGWRIGYLGADASIASAIATLQSHSTSNPASISQAAALEAMQMDQSVVNQMRDKFEKRRDIIIKKLNGIKDISYTVPKGAFYMYCNISKTKMKAGAFADRLLKEKLVAVIPCEAFGSDKHVRLSFATSMDNINNGLDRIKSWLRQ